MGLMDVLNGMQQARLAPAQIVPRVSFSSPCSASLGAFKHFGGSQQQGTAARTGASVSPGGNPGASRAAELATWIGQAIGWYRAARPEACSAATSATLTKAQASWRRSWIGPVLVELFKAWNRLASPRT